jgi:hypothetical protein
LPISIQPYLREHEPAVVEFNRRLQAGTNDPNLVFPKSAVPRWLPPQSGSPVWNDFFVAVEGSAVRGAYAIKHERLFIRGKGIVNIACYHHSLAEGIVDRSYASVGALLARDALARQPLLYALGMGGSDSPIARMIKALGFSLTLLPFYFRVVHPTKFLREMQALRAQRWRAVLLDLAAITGTGWLGIKAAQYFGRRHRGATDFVAEEVNEFSTWTDHLWDQAKSFVTMAAVRDSETLRLLYPPDQNTLTRIRVSRGNQVIGWAVVGERRKDEKFGTMRVGSVIDCWASPENAGAVVQAAAKALEKRGVDLIVSNQAHEMWCRSFEQNGFLKGPSNFVLALSKKLTELLQPLQETRPSFHVTRADGDGLPNNF